MDDTSQARLDEIVKKLPTDLTENEKAFIKARRDYLKPSQLSDYKSILNQTLKRPVKKKYGKTQKTK